jgi:glucan 1,3-beta-glucosidase
MAAQVIRGVNLGGWLVLEKWMKPELFDGLKALDETSFCRELGNKAALTLRAHHESFITECDFQWIAAHGLNLVRIPVGHWLFGDKPPFIGAFDILDKALVWAEKYNLDVLIDLHAAQGCQNGFDNGGIQNVMEWPLYQENIDDSVRFIERLAERYKDCKSLWGIQLLNEPRWDVSIDVLRGYYERGYQAVRKHCGDRVCVVFHDGFRFALNGGDVGAHLTDDYLPALSSTELEKIKVWEGFMPNSTHTNVMMDTHIYQCHAPYHHVMDLFEHVEMMRNRVPMMQKMSNHFRVMVGEWSLAQEGTLLEGTTEARRDAICRLYANLQLELYERLDGWVFWNYKLGETSEQKMPHWSYRECVNRGWLPASYQLS